MGIRFRGTQAFNIASSPLRPFATPLTFRLRPCEAQSKHKLPLHLPFSLTATGLPTVRTLASQASSTMPLTTDQIVSKLFDPARSLPPLEPGKTVYDESLVKEIAALKENKFVIASLHLANDDIHHAHLIAQDNEGLVVHTGTETGMNCRWDKTADLLHATLHRREGDYWNSKYWWSHIRSHPLVPSVTDSKAFVDACERAKGNGDEEEKLKQRQWDELKKLVEWTRKNCK